MKDFPVITLCGSTRFKNDFLKVQKELTLQGYIVISVGLFGHSGDNEVWDGMGEDAISETKVMLDEMHKRKIDMADEIYVINPGGYLGDSTKSEIIYAHIAGKKIKSLDYINLNVVEDAARERIKKAEEIAWYNVDSLIHQGEYTNNGMGYPYLSYKGNKIFDPWACNDIEMTDVPMGNHKNVDPFKKYGRQKIAQFIEEVTKEHG